MCSHCRRDHDRGDTAEKPLVPKNRLTGLQAFRAVPRTVTSAEHCAVTEDYWCFLCGMVDNGGL